jgi:integrase
MARGRHQRGWLRTEKRSNGETWMLHFRAVRESDGHRVEHKILVGFVRDLPSKASAWKEVDRLHLGSQINEPGFRGRITFADLAHHYERHELGEQDDAVDPKAHTTIAGYKRVLRNRLIPRWGQRIALGIQPLEIEQWLKGLKREESLQNPTLDRMRRVMNLVYKHGQRYGLIPRSEESNPLRFVRCKTTSDYEALIITPQQAFALLLNMPDPERTLTLLASGTGLRISECLGLQWADVDFAESQIHVRRTWVLGKVGNPKSKASKAPVPLHPLLAEFIERWKRETAYSQPTDWVFPSTKLKGKQPRVSNMLVKCYVRLAAAKAGILSSHLGEEGTIVEDDPRRFGFHNLRHSLASFLVRSKTDPKTVQALLRHSDVRTTLQLYAHSVTEDRLAAQETALQAILKNGNLLPAPANC